MSEFRILLCVLLYLIVGGYCSFFVHENLGRKFKLSKCESSSLGLIWPAVGLGLLYIGFSQLASRLLATITEKGERDQ